MSEKNNLSLAIRAALTATAVGGLASGGTIAFAEAEDEESYVEEVVVTGSRIKRAVDDEANPVTFIQAADIEVSGFKQRSGRAAKHYIQQLWVIQRALWKFVRTDCSG